MCESNAKANPIYVPKSIYRRTLAEQGTNKWKNIRKKMVSATNVAPILGVGPRSINDVFLEKTGQVVTVENDAMRFGTRMEAHVRQAYEHFKSIRVAEVGLIRHPVRKWLGASPDGYCEDNTLLEIKCTQQRILRESPPSNYRIQCETQLECVPEASHCMLFEVKLEQQVGSPSDITWRDFTDEEGVAWRIVDFRLHKVMRDTEWFDEYVYPRLEQFHKDTKIAKAPSSKKKKRSREDRVEMKEANKRIRKYSDDMSSYATTTQMAYVDIGDHVSARLECETALRESNMIAKIITVKKHKIIHELDDGMLDSAIIESASDTTHTQEALNDNSSAIFNGVFSENGILTRIDALIREDQFKRFASKSKSKSSSSSNKKKYVLCYIRTKRVDSKKDDLPKSKDWNMLRSLAEYDKELLRRCKIPLRNEVFVLTNCLLRDAIELDPSDSVKPYGTVKKTLESIQDVSLDSIVTLPGIAIRLNNGWLDAKRSYAYDAQHVSVLPGIRQEQVSLLADHGVTKWTDPKCIKVLKDNYSHYQIYSRWEKLIRWNKNDSPRILHIEDKKALKTSLGNRKSYANVYMDVETTGHLSIDGERSWVFMIGLGHLSNGRWIYKSFIMNMLTERDEQRIAKEYYHYLDQISKDEKKPLRIYHWGHIEQTIFTKLGIRYRGVPDFDPAIHVNMETIFRKNPILVKGCFNTKLKDISKILVKANYKVLNVQNGCDAMEAASRIYKQSVIADDDWNNIRHYNELDCRTLFDIHKRLVK
jgi:putative phage-type endonuclease